MRREEGGKGREEEWGRRKREMEKRREGRRGKVV